MIRTAAQFDQRFQFAHKDKQDAFVRAFMRIEDPAQ
jgi:hypothetical protein